jgi:exonuclease SbcC
MRLHSLSMTAFGPFAGTETVDFDELATAGLFLFSGPTGAGKTSVLDAVCFALYGQVPGARALGAGRASLRSDHAAEGVAPGVVLEVTLRGRRLRIIRSPAWDRPKRRGAGTTPEQSRVLVEELTGSGWVTHTTRLDEAGLLLGGLLGLSLQQFCQVVLLPQGQFAEFLRADADRRRALLETLFDTRRFADVESWLVTRRQAAARDLADLDDRFRQLLARVAEAAGADPPDGLVDQLAEDEVCRWTDDLLERSLGAAEVADAAAKAAAVAAETALQAVTDDDRVTDLRRRGLALQARAERLVAAQPVRDAAAAELDAARAVAPLLPVLAEAARLQTELESARVEVVTAQARLRPVLAATGTDGVTLGVARSMARATTEESATLDLLVEQEAEVARLVARADALQRTSVELAAKAAKAAEWLATVDERRSAADAAREAARRAQASLPEATRARDEAAVRLAAAQSRDALADRLRTARDEVRVLVDRHQEARDRLLRLRAERLDGMAGELAATLVAEAPCPVCGGTEHPAPATSDATRVTADDEAAAESVSTATEAARRSAERQVADLERDLGVAEARAGGDVSLVRVADLRIAWEHATAVAAELATEAARLPHAEAAWTDLAREIEQRERDRVAHEAEQRSAQARATELRDDAARLSVELVAARGDDPSIQARRERLERVTRDLEGLVGQLADLDRLETAAAAAGERAVQALADASLSLDEVTTAVRDDERLAGLDELVRRHDAEVISVAEQLAEPEISAALVGPAAATDLLREQAATAVAQRDRAMSEAHSTAARVRSLVRLGGEVNALRDERRPLAEAYRLVDGLARLAEGKSADNALRMSLSAYVLAARLEQVAAAATERLLRMSSGRYSLQHTTASSGGRARGGLTLRVLDAWTGQLRDPVTLSGGETFSASLALALGLADVVGAEAGGAVLETLFVDEGFGSLDEDTLDDVMSVLDDLREGGRTVGIVSHVADLRQRVPAQLRIDRGRTGSTIRQ